MRDEIIEDLRATKTQLAADVGFDMQRLVERIQHEERQSAAQGRTIVQPPLEKLPSLGDFRNIRFARVALT